MKNSRFLTFLLSVTCFLFIVFIYSCSRKPQDEIDPAKFKSPPSTVKIHTWWHWMDGNITKEGITKDLEAMKAQGVSQATIFDIGRLGDKDFGVPKVKFITDQWYEMFRWALQEANRLGIKIGVHNCSGWSSSGGPWITPELSMKQLVWTKTIVKGGQKLNTSLKKPFSLKNFYKDVAVIAYKTDETMSSFQLSAPKVTLNDSIDASSVTDGNPVSGVHVENGYNLNISMTAPLSFDKIAIQARRSLMWTKPDNYISSYTLSVSNDGKQYRKITDFSIKGLNKTEYIYIPLTTSRFVRVIVKALSDIDVWVYVSVTELELLKGNEKAFFSPSIPHLLEKTVSVTPSHEEFCYTSDAGKNSHSVKDIIILTDKMAADGTLQWDAPDGNWAVMRFGYTTTGTTNFTPTKEGEGLECDKMDTAAINLHFRNFPLQLVKHAGKYAGNTFKFILIDSWECGVQNWTASFPSEFEKRRGYSLIPFLPVLCGEIVNSSEESEAVLYDFRKTIADLIEQNYYERFSELCHKEKLEMHAEVIYGNMWYPPLDVLKSTKCVDMAMTEFWATANKKDYFVSYEQAVPDFGFPACAVTGYNKHVLGSEAYTGLAHYSESPYELKPFGDRAFCSGINQMILHSYILQPTDMKPGLTLYEFASHFNRNNPYWQYISEWLNFQARIQYVLQKGVTAPDVLYYLGDQLPQFFIQNQSNILPFGYLVTACNFDILKNNIEIKNGKLRLNNLSDFALLSLPSFPFMDFETLKRIEQLVKEGAVVYGPKPINTFTKNDLINNLAAFHELADKIWGKADEKNITDNAYGKGRVLWGMTISEALAKINLAPDFATNRKENNNFQFIHKIIGETNVYYVANQLNTEVVSECLFRVGDKTPEIWDAEKGSALKPSVFKIENGIIRIPVSFKPYQSLLFVFKPGKPHGFITSIMKDGKQVFPTTNNEIENYAQVVFDANGGLGMISGSSGDYTFITQDNKTLKIKHIQQEEKEITNFSAVIKFEPTYASAIAPINITVLKSLSDFENPDVRYFAGNAKYSIKFKAPQGFASAKETILLNIGRFDADADVFLNGKELGKVWNPFTELDISGLLKEDNELTVNVATVYRNRFIGDFIQYGKVQNLSTSSPINKYLDKDKPLKPSGLMGPLKLIKMSKRQVIKE